MTGLDIDLIDGVVTIHNSLPAERERPVLAAESTARPVTVVSAAPERAVVPAVVPAAVPVAASVAAVQSAPKATPVATAPVATAPVATPVSEPSPVSDGKGEVITNAMAAELSALLLAKLGSRDRASAWLRENAGVERSIYVKEDQIGSLTKKLEAMETP